MAVVIPIAFAIVQPVVQAVFSGCAIEIPITPPVFVRVPTAVTVPPVVVPPAMPSPPVIRIPSAPEFVTPLKLVLTAARITTPPAVPELRTSAPTDMLPPIPWAVR